MIERDYIMRMINMVIAMLVRMIGYKNKKEYPEALLDIQATGKTLLGIDRTLVDQFSVPQLMQLFGSDLSVAVPKSYVLGVLLKEEAEIRELMSDIRAVEDLYRKSLSLLIETYLSFGEPVEPRHLELTDAILERLSGHCFRRTFSSGYSDTRRRWVDMRRPRMHSTFFWTLIGDVGVQG